MSNHVPRLFLAEHFLEKHDQCLLISAHLFDEYLHPCAFSHALRHRVRLSFDYLPNYIFLILIDAIEEKVLQLTLIREIVRLLVASPSILEPHRLYLAGMLLDLRVLIVIKRPEKVDYLSLDG